VQRTEDLDVIQPSGGPTISPAEESPNRRFQLNRGSSDLKH